MWHIQMQIVTIHNILQPVHLIDFPLFADSHRKFGGFYHTEPKEIKLPLKGDLEQTNDMLL